MTVRVTPASAAMRLIVAAWKPSASTIAWVMSRICSRRTEARIRRRGSVWTAGIRDNLQVVTYADENPSLPRARQAGSQPAHEAPEPLRRRRLLQAALPARARSRRRVLAARVGGRSRRAAEGRTHHRADEHGDDARRRRRRRLCGAHGEAEPQEPDRHAPARL